MKSVWLKARWAAIPLVTFGLAACSASSEEITTQSLQPAQRTAIAEPDCGALKTEIDKLTMERLPEKLQQAGAKKYNPTPEEWASFPRYSYLTETYTVKKCEPALQQAKAAPQKPKAKTADASAAGAAKAAAKPATAAPAKTTATAAPKTPRATVGQAAPAAAPPAATAAAPQQPQYQGVMLQIPPQPAEQKQ